MVESHRWIQRRTNWYDIIPRLIWEVIMLGTHLSLDFYPLGLTAFGIASTLICSSLTDATHNRARWPVLVYFSICCIISSICLVIWKDPTSLKFFAWYISGASYAGQATTFAWANQICADDDVERGVVLASMK